MQAAAQGHPDQAMATPLQVFTTRPAPDKVSDGFLLGRRRPDLGQPGAQQLRQFAGIAATGLNPLAAHAPNRSRGNALVVCQ